MKTARKVDLVAPLAIRTGNPATDMHTADTAVLAARAASGAATPLSDRQGGVDSANKRSTPATQTTPGTRISTTATRTTTTRALSSACEPSADEPPSGHADFSFEELVQAYLDCRRTKRNKPSAVAFETNLEANLCQLDDELRNGSYRPGKSICFVITRPKPREVWAAEFRDRIVHHLLYNRISPRFYAGFIADSCACIPGRGTLYGAKRLLKPGEKIEALREPVRVVSPSREPLRRITDDLEYGRAECIREGFPDLTPAQFVAMFCASHKPCTPETVVTRIEFEYLEGKP